MTPTRTLINVFGIPRSGTTMLGLMLASGEDAISCGEASSWFREARYRSDATVPAVFESIKNSKERSFHRDLMDVKNVDYAVDSSKHIDWVIDHTRWAPENEINVFNILIWKSPVDLAYSWWKRGDYDKWKSYYIRYHYQALFSGLDFYTVSYDELVEDPSGILGRICEITGVPYFEGKEYFWQYDHAMMGNNSEGVQSQLREGASEFRKPAISEEFAPLAREVAASSAEDRHVQWIIESLKRRDVATVSVPQRRVSHTYTPSVFSSLAYRLYRTLKLPWLRFRWNIVEPYFGPLGSNS